MKFFTRFSIVCNKKNHAKKYSWILALSTMFFCWNGSVVNTNGPTSTEPDINFYGILEDHAHTVNVESILIGGKYESIPVYQPIASLKHNDPTQQIDPKQNKVLINLQDIASIALQHPNSPTSSSIQVNGKTYIQIVVESLHGSKKKYLVESARKISCKEIDKNGANQETPMLQVRDLNFTHVKKLTIKGFKSNYPYQAPQVSPISKENLPPRAAEKNASSSIMSQEKKEFKNNTAELLHAIEENVKNMPMDNPSAFETMRSTVLTLLKSLRDQLQKFLDMIK